MTAQRILLIDDDQLVLESMESWLQGQGYEIEAVGGIDEALQLLEKKRYELSSRISGSTDYTSFHRFELLLVIFKKTDPPEG